MLEDNKNVNDLNNDQVVNTNNNLISDDTNVKDDSTVSNTPNTSLNKPKKKVYNTQNLIMFTEDNAREKGRLGGIKSGEVKRQRKTAAELLKKILATDLTKEQVDEIVGNATNLLGGDKSTYNVMMIKALQEAMSGNIKAMEYVRDTVGDAPTQRQEIKAEMSQADKDLLDTVRDRLISG